MNEFCYGIREVNLNILKLSIMESWLGGPLEMVMGHPPYSSHTGLLHTIRRELSDQMAKFIMCQLIFFHQERIFPKDESSQTGSVEMGLARQERTEFETLIFTRSS